MVDVERTGNIAILLSVTVAMVCFASTRAEARVNIPRISCAAAQQVVAKSGAAVMTTGRHTFRRFVAHRGFCDRSQDVRPSYTQAADTAYCQVAFECYDRHILGIGGP